MKRPLAYTGFLYLGVQLGAAFLPSAAYIPLAAFLIITVFIGVKCRKEKYRSYFLMCLLVTATALIMRSAFIEIKIKPIQENSGPNKFVTAEIMETLSGYEEDTVDAVALVKEIDGQQIRPFLVRFHEIPYTQEGDVIALRVDLERPQQDRYLLRQYADGLFLEGKYIGDFSARGESASFHAKMNRFRCEISEKLEMYVPYEYAGTAAAMTIGDRKKLPSEVENTFRKAGLAHVLVVSGMHLSAVSGLVYSIFRIFAGRRAACAGAIISSLGFMVLTGCTPSVVRAGTAMILVYLGGLFRRKSDALTSVGIAALILCIGNPYAAADIGLLLSFSATLGVLWVAAARRRSTRERKRKGEIKEAEKHVRAIFWIAAVPAASSLATLPVLISIGAGVSLLTVFSNLLVVPVLPLAVGLGFATAVFGCVPYLEFLAHLTGILCAVLLRGMLHAAKCIASVPYAFIHIRGVFAVCVSAALCIIIYLLWYKRVAIEKTILVCAAFLFLTCSGYAVYDQQIVRVCLAGNGENPAVVLMQGDRTAVIFRGPESNIRKIEEIMENFNRTRAELLIDLRLKGDMEEITKTISTKTAVSVKKDVKRNETLRPFGDIEIYLRHQKNGNYAVVEIGRFRLGMNTGKVQFAEDEKFHVYIGGSGEPEGMHTKVLVDTKGVGRWENVPPDAVRCRPNEFCIHVKNGVKIKEVTYDFK